MRTANEMDAYAKSNKYIFLGSSALKHFEIIEKNLKGDENVIISLTSNGVCVNGSIKSGGTIAVALTDKGIILASKPSLMTSGYSQIINFTNITEIQKGSLGFSSGKMHIYTSKDGRIDLTINKDAHNNALHDIIEFFKSHNKDNKLSSEFRKKCNVCGYIYCFDNNDIDSNIRNQKNANRSLLFSGLNGIAGSSYHMYEQNKMAQNSLSEIIDFKKCPKCNSTDISELTKEEFEKLNVSENSTLSVSSADELRKFKELFDLGVITQEEFDAKKKQLLGL